MFKLGSLKNLLCALSFIESFSMLHFMLHFSHITSVLMAIKENKNMDAYFHTGLDADVAVIFLVFDETGVPVLRWIAK